MFLEFEIESWAYVTELDVPPFYYGFLKIWPSSGKLFSEKVISVFWVVQDIWYPHGSFLWRPRDPTRSHIQRNFSTKTLSFSNCFALTTFYKDAIPASSPNLELGPGTAAIQLRCIKSFTSYRAHSKGSDTDTVADTGTDTPKTGRIGISSKILKSSLKIWSSNFQTASTD